MAASTERAFVATPIAAAGGRVIASPFQFYTTGEEALRVVSVNSVAGVKLQIAARHVDSKGVITAHRWDHTPNSDRTTKTTEQTFGVGALLNVDVVATGATPQIGQSFVMVQLIRGIGGAALVLGTLLAAPVTATQHAAWPGSLVEASTSGLPAVRSFQVADPGLATNWQVTVPPGARWELLAIGENFTTDATAAARLPTINLVSSLGGSLLKAQAFPLVTIPANSSLRVTYAKGYVPSTVFIAVGCMAPLPADMPLLAGDLIIQGTANIQVGDQYTNIVVTVREWLDV